MCDGSRQKFCGNPSLETERLILRKLTLSDAEDVFEYAKLPDVARYVTWEAHQSLEDSKAFIQWVMERYTKDESGDWGIELKQTGKLVGTMGFVLLDVQNACGSIGYVLSKDYWGKGFMTEAVKRLIRFGFEEMKLNRIEAMHAVENEVSGRVMQKSGMSFEGVLYQRMYCKERFWDVKLYSIIKKDWDIKKDWEIQLDFAGTSDLEDILQLQKLAFQSEAAIIDDYTITPLTQTLDELQQEAQNVTMLKAVMGEKIVGSARAYEKGGTCYIGRVVVHPDCQNRGIGRKLVAAIEKHFASARYELFTGHLSQRNLAFYEKLGYKRFKRETVNDKLQFVYMEKCMEVS